MVNGCLEMLVSKSKWILSIVPPHEVFAFAEEIRGVVQESPGVFVDCNPGAEKHIGRLVRGTSMKFIDTCRRPPRPELDPTSYAYSEGEEVLEKLAALSQYGLRVSLLKGLGAGVGDGSALNLKLHESATAYRSLPSVTVNALMKELGMLQPEPEGIPKANRFICEMEGFVQFVGGGEADSSVRINYYTTNLKDPSRPGLSKLIIINAADIVDGHGGIPK
ncbi:hypothetical protein DFH29DRAFT_880897 [Suillus ampliporus]|nr:hypothetical protein DFH29DRAFT_880897 [Suillus ampliporus]